MSIELNKRAIIANDQIEDKLRSGVMPSSIEILEMLLNDSILETSSNATEIKSMISNGDVLDPKYIMELVDGIELDIIAMRQTLDESWDLLYQTLNKSIKILPIIYREADVIGAVATRALSLTPAADGVSVGSDAITISTGLGFGTADGLDMDLSENIELDLTAGALILKRSGTKVIQASSYPSSWIVDGEYNLKTDSVIGNPTWTVDGDISKLWTLYVSSPSKYGRVSISNVYDLGQSQTPIKVIEVLAPDFLDLEVTAYVDPDGLGNFEHWATSSGNGRVIIDGPSINANRVQLVFSRYVSSDRYFTSGSMRYEYSFKIAEVIFSSTESAPEGNAISDSIQMGYDQALSTTVDVDMTVQQTASVNVYIARDVQNPTSISDFNWIGVDRSSNMVDLANISKENVFITAKSPRKIQTGAGLYSNSIYSIGSTDGKIISAYDGYDQFEVKRKHVYAETVPELPALTSVDFDSEPDASVHDRTGAIIDGSNYYRISTSVFSESAVSHQIDIRIEGVVEKIVYVNGIDVTQRIEAGQRSVGFIAGKNNIVILASTGLADGDISFAISQIPGATISIDKATIVSEMSMNSIDRRISQVGQDILVNHDPTNRVFLLGIKKITGTKFDAIRIRIELKRGLQGESPQVRRAFVTTGV